MRRLLALIGAACILSWCACGDDEDGGDTSGYTYDTDLAAVSAILAANGLSAVPPRQVAFAGTIGGAYRVTTLDLRPSALGGAAVIDTIPPHIGQLTGLTTLYLDSNRIRVLPPQVGALGNLTYLSAVCDSLGGLPAELTGLVRLQRLVVTRNRIPALPATIGGLTGLQALFVDDNLLTALPDGVTGLTALQFVEIGGNQVCSLSVATETFLLSHGLDTDWRTSQVGCP